MVGVSENHTPEAGSGIFGQSDGTGVWGTSKTWMGVYGNSESTTGGAGVMGEAVGPGVIGKSQIWMGVYGETASTTGGAGVWGEHKAGGTGTVGKSDNGVGVWGTSETNEEIHAETKSTATAAIAAYNLNPDGTGAAIFAKKEGNVGHAGFVRVWFVGFHCDRESDHDQLSDTDEPYFIIGVAGSNRSNTIRFDPYENVETGTDRFEATMLADPAGISPIVIVPPIVIGVVAMEHDEGQKC